MLIQGNQPGVVKLKWLQLAQELFYLKRLAFSVWEAHIMRACRSGTGHSLYKQTGYDRCDSSHCLYSLFGMKYRLHMLGKKCWLNMEEIACLLIANRRHLWFYLLPAQLQDRPTAGPAPIFMAKGLFPIDIIGSCSKSQRTVYSNPHPMLSLPPFIHQQHSF